MEESLFIFSEVLFNNKSPGQFFSKIRLSPAQVSPPKLMSSVLGVTAIKTLLPKITSISRVTVRQKALMAPFFLESVERLFGSAKLCGSIAPESDVMAAIQQKSNSTNDSDSAPHIDYRKACFSISVFFELVQQ